jgi:hypothetical protein
VFIILKGWSGRGKKDKYTHSEMKLPGFIALAEK